MSKANGSYVLLPQLMYLDQMKIRYQDTLIYLSIRSFLNTRSKECFPAYETIAQRAGVSRSFVANSIKRLKASGLISYISGSKDVSNRYQFESFTHFERIPVEIFDLEDLTYTEKAMLICMRQFFVCGVGTCCYTVKEIADFLGLTQKTVYTQVNNLIKRGYLSKSTSSGHKKARRMKLTEKLCWDFMHSSGSQNKPIVKLKVG